MQNQCWLSMVVLLGACVSNAPPDPADDPAPSDDVDPLLVGASRPRGIYLLDSSTGQVTPSGVPVRDGNLVAGNHTIELPFVTGYVSRHGWHSFESATQPGHYDFSAIDMLMAELPAGKKLSLLLGGNGSEEPAYVAQGAAHTWSYLDNGATIVRAVPWDPYLATRFAAFAQALGDHQVYDPAVGALRALRNHSQLKNINFGIMGLGEIRDNSTRIRDIPTYTRSNMLAAVRSTLEIATAQFPRKVIYVGMWAVTDDSHQTELWQAIDQTIIQEFDGVTRPKIALWMENLAASKANGVVTGYPSTSYAAPEYTSQGHTYVGFQMLQSWVHPFSNPDRTAGSVPGDALEYGYQTFGSEYCEVYKPDLDDPDYTPGFEAFIATIGL